MEKSICDLLQQTTVDKTVQKVTELNIEEFHLTILQFIVNCLKRKFVLDMDDLNRIDSNLVILIHRSVRNLKTKIISMRLKQ